MRERLIPRPWSAGIGGYILVGLSLLGFVRGTYLMNTDYRDLRPVDVLPYFQLIPLLGAGLSYFLFRGKNWARIVYWLLMPPLVVMWVMKYPMKWTYLYAMGYFVSFLLLALPNAHWFFTGRDFHRRPGYRADFDKQENDGRSQKEKRKFEY